ncbi:MAG: carboxypeptidase-like regulatory domain-containing protein [Acidimicrobiia bacterium]
MIVRASRTKTLLMLAGTLVRAAAAPSPAAPQEAYLTGTVVDSITGAPIPAAMVIVTLPGSASFSTMSTETGRFQFRVSSFAGARLSVTALGTTEWVHPALPDSDSLDLGLLLLQPEPYTLPGLNVSADAACEAPPDSLQRAHHVMDFVRPRLQQISVNDERDDQEYVVRIVRPLRYWKGERWGWRPDTVLARVPFAVPPVDLESLREDGFAQVVSDTLHEYRAPTAAWLASAQFPVDYCLATSAQPREEGETSHGIDFWPKVRDGDVDIAGTIWLDPEGVPQEVTFEYRSLEAFVEGHQLQWLKRYWELRRPHLTVVTRLRDIDEDNHGGRLTFGEVSPGLWMTVSWEIRGVRLVSAGREEDEVIYIVPRIVPLVTSGQLIAIMPTESGRG